MGRGVHLSWGPPCGIHHSRAETEILWLSYSIYRAQRGRARCERRWFSRSPRRSCRPSSDTRAICRQVSRLRHVAGHQKSEVLNGLGKQKQSQGTNLEAAVAFPVEVIADMHCVSEEERKTAARDGGSRFRWNLSPAGSEPAREGRAY